LGPRHCHRSDAAGRRQEEIYSGIRHVYRRASSHRWETSGDAETWPAQWATEVMPLANAALSRIQIGNGTHAENEERGLTCTWPVTLGRDYTSWGQSAGAPARRSPDTWIGGAQTGAATGTIAAQLNMEG
jgi:hypothetical protein